jgi:hypothetical protein
VVLAGGPLGAWPAALLVGSRLGGALAGRLGVAAAVGVLLGLDPRDGRAGSLPVGPLAWVMRLGAEGLLGVGDLVAVPVLFDFGRGLTPGPPTPGGGRHRAQRLQDVAGTVGFDGYASGAPLPGQGPHHLLILQAEVGIGFQPALAALLVLAQLAFAVMGPVELLGGHRRPTRHLGAGLVATAAQPAKHAGARPATGLVVSGQDILGLLAVDGGLGQLAAAVAGSLIQLAAELVPLSPQLTGRQSLEIGATRSVNGQGLPAGPGQGLGQLQIAIRLVAIGEVQLAGPWGSGPTIAYRRVSWRARDSWT